MNESLKNDFLLHGLGLAGRQWSRVASLKDENDFANNNYNNENNYLKSLSGGQRNGNGNGNENASSNSTNFEILMHFGPAPHLTEAAVIRAYVLFGMAFVSLCGNMLTIRNILRSHATHRNVRHGWNAIYLLLFHLSIADLLVTCFCIAGEGAWTYTVQWLAGDWMCRVFKCFQMFSLYLSTYILVLIGFDRWIALRYPLKSLHTSKRINRMLIAVYCCCLILSLPQLCVFHVVQGPFKEDFLQCVTYGSYTAEWQEQLYAFFTLFFTFVLPLCTLLCTYLSSFCTIADSEKLFKDSLDSQGIAQANRQRLLHKAKAKSLRISFVIIFAFVICWTPYYAMMIIFMFWNPDEEFAANLQAVIFFFGMSNSLLNPLIYGAFHLSATKRPKKSFNNVSNSFHLKCFQTVVRSRPNRGLNAVMKTNLEESDQLNLVSQLGPNYLRERSVLSARASSSSKTTNSSKLRESISLELCPKNNAIKGDTKFL